MRTKRANIACIAPYWWRVASLVLLAGYGIQRPVAAEQIDAVNVVIGGSVRTDSNLFKRPTATSDTIDTGYIGLRVDKPYWQQRFQLDVTETTTRYGSNSRLNFDARDYRGAWLWQLGSRLSGTLNANHKESLVPFEDTSGNSQRNVRLSDNRAFNLDGWLAGGWHVLAGLSQADQKSEQTVQTQPDFRAVTAEAGLQYKAPSGSSVTATRRSSHGDYRGQLVAFSGTPANRNYQQNETELKLNWILSEKSSMNGRLAWLARTNSNPSQPAFSGPSGNLSYSWTPTAKLSLSISGSQQTSALLDPSFNHTETSSLSITPAWKASDKTTVSLALTHSTLKYRGTGSVPPTGPGRSDATNSAALNVGWTPLRSVLLNASLQRYRRTSNDPLFGYDATVGSVSASLTF